MSVDSRDRVAGEDAARHEMAVELVPTTQYDSVAAVLYRVAGERLDIRDAQMPFGAALREALEPRLIPRQRSVRRRWVAAVVTEQPHALASPPQERPALLRALKMSLLLAGGILFEQPQDLGKDLIGRAAVIEWLVENAGTPGVTVPPLDEPDLALHNVGTFTIGFLGPAGRRHVDRHLLHAAALEWNREVHAALPGPAREVGATYNALDEAVRQDAWTAKRIAFFEPTTDSMLVSDLSADQVPAVVADLRRRGANTQRVIATLNLLGYLNPAGHRVWNRTLLTEVERHD